MKKQKKSTIKPKNAILTPEMGLINPSITPENANQPLKIPINPSLNRQSYCCTSCSALCHLLPTALMALL
jgi:hypothetical protein